MSPSVKGGDRHTLTHGTTADHEDRTGVAAVRSECTVHYATWTPQNLIKRTYISGKIHGVMHDDGNLFLILTTTER